MVARSALIALSLGALAHAHVAAWTPGMYCKGGPDASVDDQDTNTAVNPLFNLQQQDWWFQHDRGCDAVPPPEGEFLDIPAGSSFTVELADNRAFTTLSFGGSRVSEWCDGGDHPEDWHSSGPDTCLTEGGGFMHTQNQSMAAGTAWAISYTPNLSEVTIDNLVVFSTLANTPWKREASYDVPADLPACPDGGCTCAWLWVPNGCGEPNMYMAGYKCNVTGAISTTPLPAAKAPVWCAEDSSQCTKGAKQMIAWQREDTFDATPESVLTNLAEASGNNYDASNGQSPAYSYKLGYAAGKSGA